MVAVLDTAHATASDASLPIDGRWTTRAFGMVIRGGFETLAFELTSGLTEDSMLEIDVVSTSHFDRAWTPRNAVRAGKVSWDDGGLCLTIDADPDLGYRVWTDGVGRYRVSSNGRRLTCAPGDLTMWEWQRFLLAQLLPLAAALRGYEVLHASAVQIGNRGVALVGNTGAGKTSLAINLVLQGAGFLADDVLVLERSNRGVRAHAGAPIAGIRHAEVDRLSQDARQSLGEEVGRNEKEVLYKLSRGAAAVPLGALYFIDRGSTTSSLAFEPVTDPRLLMSSTFNFVHRPPDRLAELLDICARIDATASVLRVVVPPEMDATGLATAIRRHAETIA